MCLADGLYGYVFRQLSGNFQVIKIHKTNYICNFIFVRLEHKTEVGGVSP
jgi:hypothetical protein